HAHLATALGESAPTVCRLREAGGFEPCGRPGVAVLSLGFVEKREGFLERAPRPREEKRLLDAGQTERDEARSIRVFEVVVVLGGGPRDEAPFGGVQAAHFVEGRQAADRSG